MILETESISVSNTNDSKIFLVTYNGGALLENKAWFPVMKLNDKKIRWKWSYKNRNFVCKACDMTRDSYFSAILACKSVI